MALSNSGAGSSSICDWNDDWDWYWDDNWWEDVNFDDFWDDNSNHNWPTSYNRYLWKSLYLQFPFIYDEQYSLVTNLGLSNIVFANSFPPISITQLLNEASNYNTYNYLRGLLNTFDANTPNEPLWNTTIDNSSNAISRMQYKQFGLDSQNNLRENVVKEIIIKSPVSMKEGLLDLVFEMTNASNGDKYAYIQDLAIKNGCTKNQYVYNIMYYESLSLYYEMVMAEELNFNLTQEYAPSIVSYYNDYRNGQIAESTFLERVTNYDLVNDLFRVNKYKAQYDQLRQMGIQAGYP